MSNTLQAVEVVKRGGRRGTEEFNHAKLHHSVRAACLSVRSPEGEAETVAQRVGKCVSDWVSDRSAVTSADIRRVASNALATFEPEAAYLYQNHNLVV